MQNVADTLTSKYTWNKFTFDATPGTPLWRFRYLISCIIVGGNNEADTLRCDKELFTRYPTVEALAAAKFRDLADLLEKYDLQYAGNKAKHIIDTSSKIAVLGDVPDNRDAFECLPGVGRHVASVILATCFGQDEFAVDIHVRRIAKRIGLVDEDATDRAIEKAVRAAVQPDQYGHFSRSFVDFGQTICGFRPKCGSCSLTQTCKSVTVSTRDRFALTTDAKAGAYSIGQYMITVADGYAKCNCMAGKHGRNCRHVKQIVTGEQTC